MKYIVLLFTTLLLSGCLAKQTDTAYLQEVNSTVNKLLTYKVDPTDHWQTPQETLALKTGDCEDYALLKAYILKEGLIHIVQVQTPPKQFHAILQVCKANTCYYLDNRYKRLLDEYTKLELYGDSLYVDTPEGFLAVRH